MVVINIKKYSLIIFILIIISFFNPLIEVSAYEGYDYVGTYYIQSQINMYSDDVISMLNIDYQASSTAIPLKSTFGDIMIGLRFNNISMPVNTTHTSIIQWAYLSLWSDQDSINPDYRSMVTLYYINQDNPNTFYNYTDLTTRPLSTVYINWDAYNLYGQKWVNTSDIKDIVLPKIPINNNGSLGFIILSAKGNGIRHFTSWDWNPDYAPKLYICYRLYKIKSGYQETYKGFDIYENHTSLNPIVNIEDVGYIKYCMEIDGQDFDKYLIVDLSFFDTYWSYDYFIQIPNGTLYSPLVGSLFKSNDRGKTWENLGAFIQDDEWSSGICSIHYFNGTLHFVYNSMKTGYSTYTCMIYRNLTLSNSIFGDSIVLKHSTLGSQGGANIAMDKLGNIYVGWYGAQGGSSSTRSYFKQYNITTKNWEATYNQPLTLGKHVWTGIECEQNHTGQNAWVFVCYHHWYAGSDTVLWRLRNETLSWSGETTLDGGASYVDTEMDKYNQVHTTTYESQIIHYRKYNRNTGMGSVLTVDSPFYYPTIGCYNNSVYIYYCKVSPKVGYYKYKLYNETTFSSRYQILDTPYVNTIPLKYFSETSLKEGKEDEPFYFIDDENVTCNMLKGKTYKTIEELKYWIDFCLSGQSTSYDAMPYLGNWILAGMGLIGLILIPLSFIIFGLSIKSGDFMNAVYLFIILFFIGIGMVAGWLWA